MLVSDAQSLVAGDGGHEVYVIVMSFRLSVVVVYDFTREKLLGLVEDAPAVAGSYGWDGC